MSSVGTQMSNTAKLWVLFSLTHSAATLGLDGLCFSVPIVILPLAAGPVCDRVDRRTIIGVSMAAECTGAAALTALSAAGLLRPWIIYLTAVVEAARLAFDIPARTALTTVLVPGDALASAQSLSVAVWNSAALIGPALAGLLLAVSPAGVVFAANAVTTLAAAVAFRKVRRARLPAPAGGAAARGRPGDGLRHAFACRELLALQAILLAVSAAALGTETLLPVLARVQWHGGPVAYGMLRAAPGVAAAITGLAAAVLRPARRPRRTLLVTMTGAGAALAAFALAPVLAAGFVLLALASAAISVCLIHVSTRVQQITPERLRGSVSGFSAVTQNGLAGVAAAGMAFTATGPGARTVIIAVAAITATTGLLAPKRTHQDGCRGEARMPGSDVRGSHERDRRRFLTR